MKRMRLPIFLLALSIVFFSACAPTRVVRYPATRWLQDNDRIPIDKPKTRREYSIADGVQYQFFYQLERLVDIPLRGQRALHALGAAPLEEAYNTNNFDEVADSTWFTNRLGKQGLSAEELRRAGTGTEEGPDPRGPWKIIQAKKAGVSPGFLIEDSAGEKFFLKFDPPDNLEMMTAAEVIGTRIIYAMGYNVAQTYIVNFSPSILRISEKLSSKKASEKDFLNQEKLDEMLRDVPRLSDGRLRAVASRFLEGEIIGPFPIRGKRRGDANDRIPHEHRREIRGYRYFSALIGNTDVREGNSLDSFIRTGPGDKGYVKHYMMDFGNSLGSATVKSKSKMHYQDYEFNYGEVLATTVTLGGYRRNYEKIEDPGMPSVGLFESKYFKPQTFRPHYPYPPFQNTTDRDAFWATKILTRLSDQQIALVVKEGRYSDPRAEAYVTKTLIERRNKIRDHWFTVMNPLDNFKLSAQAQGVRVDFEDLAVVSGLRPAGSALYRFRVLQERGVYEAMPWTETSVNSLVLPSEVVDRLQAGKPYLLQLQTKAQDQKFFGPIIDLIIQKDDQLRLLGLKRRYDA
ncbi:MAG TPA: hypothetical protein VFW62_05665 [bacterium]|nr:hypothetical protein [bacterium]